MKPLRFLISVSMLGLCAAAPLTVVAQDKIAVPDVAVVAEAIPPRIQVALLLDTSNSMDGLIAQTKSQLWMLVNELAEGEKDGKTPLIELALYEYGNSNLSVGQGYIRQVLSLTSDLDDVSEKLFALSTNGGQEYAGQVISTAIEELEWSSRSEDMKLVIIAGNEPFTQGPITYQSACALAQKKGVIIDTIHCGDERTGIETKWKAGADCGGGVYMTINQDEESVYIASPYDQEILDLNTELNETYISYGESGRAYKARQAVQDSNASRMSLKSAISRAKTKASAGYKNESWDLVDAYEENETKALEMPEDQLPEDMKGMDKDQRAAFIEQKQKERETVRQKINELQAKQKAYVAKEKASLAKSRTIDEIVVTAVRDQAKDSGFKFKE